MTQKKTPLESTLKAALFGLWLTLASACGVAGIPPAPTLDETVMPEESELLDSVFH